MNKTAVILFANLPEFEARAKSFSAYSSQKATQQISKVLTQHFFKLSKQTTADTFLIDSYHQKGKSFGQRIANAFADVYAKGYENVICIGNDCLELDLLKLQTAIQAVENSNVVLGPTQDGGAYLIGIPRQQFNYLSFIDVNWEKSYTFKNLKNQFHSQIVQLKVLVDIDTANDLNKINRQNKLVYFIIEIVNVFKFVFKFLNTPNKQPQIALNADFLRGPPLSF